MELQTLGTHDSTNGGNMDEISLVDDIEREEFKINGGVNLAPRDFQPSAVDMRIREELMEMEFEDNNHLDTDLTQAVAETVPETSNVSDTDVVLVGEQTMEERLDTRVDEPVILESTLDEETNPTEELGLKLPELLDHIDSLEFSDEAKGELKPIADVIEQQRSEAPVEESVVDSVFNELVVHEGESGDTATDVETGEIGVTDFARGAVEDGFNKPDKQVAKEYLGLLKTKWDALEGYADASPELQKVLLDSSYNMGESVLKFNGLKKALKSGDEEGVVKNLLDTASADKKALRGLAKRRALQYNKIAKESITRIEQKEDGTLIYLSDSDKEIFKYRPKKGRHPKSGVGFIDVK